MVASGVGAVTNSYWSAAAAAAATVLLLLNKGPPLNVPLGRKKNSKCGVGL